MDKLDKQFGEMMKSIRIDTPSPDFTLKVMSRIQAEAAVTERPLHQEYQPVISKKTWIILLVIFIGLLIYISVSGSDSKSANDSSLWNTLTGSLSKLNSVDISMWKKGMGIFTTVPAVAYLILIASLALWTLDSFLNRLRHNHSKINVE